MCLNARNDFCIGMRAMLKLLRATSSKTEVVPCTKLMLGRMLYALQQTPLLYWNRTCVTPRTSCHRSPYMGKHESANHPMARHCTLDSAGHSCNDPSQSHNREPPC